MTGEQQPTPEPTQRLAPAARRAWRINALATGLPLVLGGLLVSERLRAADAVPSGLAALPLVAALLGAIVVVVVIPELRWRRWRYEVRAEEIDIRHGAVTVRRTLVPMQRVQHVDTERGIVQQSLDLATVAFHTAAGRNEIPQLTTGEAARVRDRIAELTRTPDEL